MLRIGNLRENVLKRSVLKEIHNKRKEIMIGAKIYEDASVVNNNKDYVISTSTISLQANDAVIFGIKEAVNKVASMGSDPIGIKLTLTLPLDTDERILKQILRLSEETCKELDIEIAGCDAEVSRYVTNTVITVTAFGNVLEKDIFKTSNAQTDDDIIITKWIGLEGTSLLAREKKSLLEESFPRTFVERASDFDKLVSIINDVNEVKKLSINSLHSASKGGIFGALWELAESSKKGLDINLKDIPVKQETIEICEIFGLNPYELISSGSLLITAKDGQKVIMELEKAGINAVIVGKVTEGADRTIRNEEELRYLEPPKEDEIFKIL